MSISPTSGSFSVVTWSPDPLDRHQEVLVSVTTCEHDRIIVTYSFVYMAHIEYLLFNTYLAYIEYLFIWHTTQSTEMSHDRCVLLAYYSSICLFITTKAEL